MYYTFYLTYNVLHEIYQISYIMHCISYFTCYIIYIVGYLYLRVSSLLRPSSLLRLFSFYKIIFKFDVITRQQIAGNSIKSTMALSYNVVQCPHPKCFPHQQSMYGDPTPSKCFPHPNCSPHQESMCGVPPSSTRIFFMVSPPL